MTVSELKSRNRVNLINPFLWYSLYVQLKTHLYDGNSSADLAMIPIKHFHYLPSLRMPLTPFGPEYHLENYLRFNTRVALVDVHVGDKRFYRSWGGVGVSVQNVLQRKRLSVDIDLAAWKQPGLELIRRAEGFKGEGTGGSLSFTGHYDLSTARKSASVLLQLGYKSAGYLEGYDLHASPIFMIGLGYRH